MVLVMYQYHQLLLTNSVALGTDTTGSYVGTITAGTGLTSTGATSGEGITHTLQGEGSITNNKFRYSYFINSR